MMIGRLLQRQSSQRVGSVLSRQGFSTSASTKSASDATKKTTRAAAHKRRSRKSKSSGVGKFVVVGGLAGAGVGAAVYFDVLGSNGEDSSDSTQALGKAYNPAKEGAGTFAGYVHNIMDYFRGDDVEHDGKLLPDYENSVFYQEGVPPPLTLVVDFEETLGTSTWDRRHGWRFVKRPGLDLFLHQMARCGYEVVVFSTNPSVGAVEDSLALLDPMGQYIPYKLFCNSASFQNERYVKDLSKLNRDPTRVIVVDDNIADLVTNQENCIEVKPFDDIEVTDDDTLQKLGIYLQSLASSYSQGRVKDVRQELRKFKPGDEEGEPDFLENFSEFLEKQRAIKQKRRESGLAGRLRKAPFGLKAKPNAPQQQQSASPIPTNPLLGQVPGTQALPAAVSVLPQSNVRYRKTIWERMTDPETAQKQDKELQEKERQWKLYAGRQQ